MDCENCMASWRCHIHTVITNCTILFTLEQTVKGLFFVLAVYHGQPFDNCFTIRSILDCNGTAWLLMRRHWSKHVEHELVIDFYKWDLDGYGIVETAANLWEDRIDAPWHKSSILVVGSRPSHGERLSSTCLSITHNCAVETINHFVYRLLCTILKDIFLRSVMKNLVEFKFPCFSLIIDYSFASVFCNTHCDGLNYIWLRKLGALTFVF